MLKHGDGYAPGALARDHPVGLCLDHAAQAIAPRGGHEFGVFDALERGLAQAAIAAPAWRVERPVHGDEPLRRVAEDHGLLRAPGVRILMFEPPARDQRVGRDQRLDDRLVGITLVALIVDDALALETRRLFGETAVAVHGEGDHRIDAALFQLGGMLLPNLEIFATMPGCGVDETGAVLVGNMIARE